MASYIARRLFYALLTFLGITVAVFTLIHAVPGDPIDFYLSASGPGVLISPEVIARIRSEQSLDRPLTVQYLRWLARVTVFDFGSSFIDRRDVSGRVLEKLPNTLLLNVLALAFSLAVAIPAGVMAAARRDGWFDRISRLILVLFYSLPSFWIALLLAFLFAVRLDLLPLYGMTSDDYETFSTMQRLSDRLWHLILPVLSLSLAQIAIFARFSRSSLLEVLSQDFITTARAKGVSETGVIVKHAFRNSMLPLITVVALTLPWLLSGSVIIERLFQWDGIGRLYFHSIQARDYPTIMGLTVMTAMAVLLVSFLTDVAYAIIDPRVRLRESTK